MTTSASEFVWYELMTTDTSAATEFYHGVVGWQASDSGMTDRLYTILGAGEVPVAGLMPLPEAAQAAGAPPHWIGYVSVPDVDAAVGRLTTKGGMMHRDAEDIPGVGRFAVVSDPQGASFVLFTAAAGYQRPQLPPSAPGNGGWRELHAADWESAFAFYADMFGWTKADAIDMGPMGTYQLFTAGGMPIGGMMTKMDNMPRPAWSYYFNVDDIHQAVARVRQGGGQVLNGPHEVPGGSWIINGLDPQGAAFSLVQPPR